MEQQQQQNDEFSHFKQELRGVKELLDSGIKHIPKFYVNPQQGEHLNEAAINSEVELPMIDLAGLHGPERAQIVQAINKACEEWGFFQIINHGVPSSVMQNMIQVIKEFFDMPIEERMEYYSNNLFDPVRFGTSHNPSKESVLEWKDYLRHPCLPLEQVISTWPSKPPSYREAAKAYSQAVKGLADKFLEVMSEGLGLKSDYLAKAFGNHAQVLASNYYPPCPNPELTIGISKHSDAGGVTVLLQNEVEGLEVSHDGFWVPVKPIKDALVVNLGDHSQIISNGRYKSVEHRAKVNSEKLRISIATFYQPSRDADTCPIPELLDKNHPPVYRRMKFGDFLSGFFSANVRIRLSNGKLALGGAAPAFRL